MNPKKTENKMQIRETRHSELDTILSVARSAFGSDEVPDLVRDLLSDPTANPTLSLLAFDGDRAVGHILFTSARLEPEAPLSISILAPLAVVPDRQKQGIGRKLIEHGLRMLRESGIDLVFVLGHPAYYPRHGFRTAGWLGFNAPYPIPEKDADAWMVQALQPGKCISYKGTVICAEKLNRPEHWRE